jgi:TonB family protein
MKISTMKFRLLLGFLFLPLLLRAQPGKWLYFEVFNGDTINCIDSSNRMQGLWKFWDNNLALVFECHYEDDKPVGKQTYFQKNRTILELEPIPSRKELIWKYYGSGKMVRGKLLKKSDNFEFVNVEGKKLSRNEISILTDLMELDATYQGGYYELFKYFREKIRYPRTPEQEKKGGIVEITFKVKENGTIDDVRLVSGFDIECNEATLECVKSMPRWRPAIKLGYAFESMVKVPVQFKPL